MNQQIGREPGDRLRDLIAGVVVFIVTTALCLGIASVSGAPPMAGIITAVVGGVLVGFLSGSQTAISGPTAGLTAVVAAQITALGSYETFLLAVVAAGVIQIALGWARLGAVADYVPTVVVKGMVAAVGIILVLKQIPHLIGHDVDPEGEMSFFQPDHKNTFTELLAAVYDVHWGATAVGIASLLMYFYWHRRPWAKSSPVPAAFVALLTGVSLNLILRGFNPPWLIENGHLVQIPLPADSTGLLGFLRWPDFSQWNNPAVYSAALIIAVVASLESLLNIDAMDAIDEHQRSTPPNRELVAQGIGNVVVGLIGGIPMTSVTVTSALGLHAGSRTRWTAIVQGLGLLLFVAAMPRLLGYVPVSCLAAIVFATGVRLIAAVAVERIWKNGKYQLIPFVITVSAIVLTDILVGILIGLGVSLALIVNSTLRRPVRRFVEKRLGGKVIHIELANQVSFLNRPALLEALDAVPRGGQLLLDAQNTDFVDPDVLDLIRNFTERTAPARNIEVSLMGFRSKYQVTNRIQFVDHSTRELQSTLTPMQVLQILKDGHERFRTGRRLTRDFSREVHVTAAGQHPLAAVLSCMDSRSSAELIFDVGVGEVFGVRVAGNILSRKVLGSLEYACAVAGAKLILVMGHTRCGAVTTAVKLACATDSVAKLTGCNHAEYILQDIQAVIDPKECRNFDSRSEEDQRQYVDQVARANVLRSIQLIEEQSETLRKLAQQQKLLVVGAIYDVATGGITFLHGDGRKYDSILFDTISDLASTSQE